MHKITDIFSFEATESGALAGHEALCSCGDRFKTSLSEQEAARLGEAHVKYFTGAKKAAKRSR